MAMSSLALWGFSNSSAFAWTFKQFPVAAELISTVMRSAYSMGVLGEMLYTFHSAATLCLGIKPPQHITKG